MAGFPCRAPWDGAVIHFSGAVYPCNNISQGPEMAQMRLGDLNDNTLHEILNGPKAKELRRRLLDGDISGLLCATCDKAQTCNPYGDPQFGQEGSKIHGGAELQAVVPDLNPMPLQRLELGLTDLCNMNCIMCCLSWGEASPKDEPQRGMIKMALLERLLEELPGIMEPGFVVWLHWIGEPLIYPHIDELCQKLDAHGATLHLVTNAIQLKPQRQKRLMQLRSGHTINISLNALNPVIFEQVNQSKTHSLVMKHTHEFVHAAIVRKKWNVVLSAVVLRENWRDVILMVAYWQRIILEHGAKPSLVVNGKPDANRVVTPYQIALLREVAEPSSIVYFRMVLRSCLPDVDGWDLPVWDDFDQALISSRPQEILLAIDGLSPSDREKADLIVIDLAAHEPMLVAQILDRLPSQTCEAVLRIFVEENWAFENSKPAICIDELSPSACLHLALCFPLLRTSALLCLRQSALWNAGMIGSLAQWLIGHPDLPVTGFPELFPDESPSGSLVRFWQGEDVQVVPAIDHPELLNGFAGIISLRDRPQWAITVSKQPCRTIQSKLLESLDPARWPQCIQDISVNSETESWLLRTIRRRILFAGVEYRSFLKLVPPKIIHNSQTWELWLLCLLGGIEWTMPEIVCADLHTPTAYSDLAEVLSVIVVSEVQRDQIAKWCSQALRCPLLSLSSQARFGLIRLWGGSTVDKNWSGPVPVLPIEDLESWQAEIIKDITAIQ